MTDPTPRAGFTHDAECELDVGAFACQCPRHPTPRADAGREERVVRHPDGHLMVERLPLPSAEYIGALFTSIAKAGPHLAKYAPHFDGEFDNALTNLRRVIDHLLRAARGGGAG